MIASTPLTSCQILIVVVKVKAVTDYFFLGFKITLDSDSSHEIKRYLLLGRKAMTNVDSVLKAETSFLTPLCQSCIVK